jgi:hypothetical protein
VRAKAWQYGDVRDILLGGVALLVHALERLERPTALPDRVAELGDAAGPALSAGLLPVDGVHRTLTELGPVHDENGWTVSGLPGWQVRYHPEAGLAGIDPERFGVDAMELSPDGLYALVAIMAQITQLGRHKLCDEERTLRIWLEQVLRDEPTAERLLIGVATGQLPPATAPALVPNVDESIRLLDSADVVAVMPGRGQETVARAIAVALRRDGRFVARRAVTAFDESERAALHRIRRSGIGAVLQLPAEGGWQALDELAGIGVVLGDRVRVASLSGRRAHAALRQLDVAREPHHRIRLVPHP